MRYFEKNLFKEIGFFYLIYNIFWHLFSFFIEKKKVLKFKEDILSNKNVYNYLKFWV